MTKREYLFSDTPACVRKLLLLNNFQRYKIVYLEISKSVLVKIPVLNIAILPSVFALASQALRCFPLLFSEPRLISRAVFSKLGVIGSTNSFACNRVAVLVKFGLSLMVRCTESASLEHFSNKLGAFGCAHSSVVSDGDNGSGDNSGVHGIWYFLGCLSLAIAYCVRAFVFALLLATRTV